jgi:Thioesterase-like superfamily
VTAVPGLPFDAYYLPAGPDRYLPTEATTSPWDTDAQHGGPPAALLATAADRALADPGMRLARITVEFLGVIPRRELIVDAAVRRPGRRVALTEASLVVDGRAVALARVWHARVGVEPPAGSRRPAVAAPDLPATQRQRYFPGLVDWGYGRSIEWRLTSGGIHLPGPGAAWTRVQVPLIAGEPLTGLQRMLVVADAANGLSAELPLDTWYFIPPGLTVTLIRHTEREWVHLRAESDVGTDGIGLTVGTLTDADGMLGQVSQPLLVAPR